MIWGWEALTILSGAGGSPLMSMGWPEGQDPDTGEGWASDRSSWFPREEVKGHRWGQVGRCGSRSVRCFHPTQTQAIMPTLEVRKQVVNLA